MDHPANSSALEVGSCCTSDARPSSGFYIDGRAHAQPRKRIACTDCAINRHFLDCALVRNGRYSSPQPKPHRRRALCRACARLGVRGLVYYDLNRSLKAASSVAQDAKAASDISVNEVTM